MSIDKQQLEDAYEAPFSSDEPWERHASDVLSNIVILLIISAIVNGILIVFLGPIGMLLAVIVQIVVLYRIVYNTFETIDNLVVDRIRRREQQIVDELNDE